MRTDPVPTVPSRYTDGFLYGPRGNSAYNTYQALVRCALDVDTPEVSSAILAPRDSSELWRALSTTTGPLRLTWPQIQRWARADLEDAGQGGSPYVNLSRRK